MEDILAIVLIFGGGSLFLLAISPIGKAVADRIRGGGGAPHGSDAIHEALEGLREDMLTEMQQLRKDVNELGERVDFTERMLAQHREAERLPPAR